MHISRNYKVANVPLDLDREIHLYADFMEEIKGRVLIVKAMANGLPRGISSSHENFVKAECIILQTRLICELIALAALVAHNPLGLTKDLLKSWNADKSFRMLEDLNPDCFPIALDPTTLGGRTHYGRVEGQLNRKDLAKIYEQCGALLHRGILRHALKENKRVLDLDFVSEAIDRIIALLNCHAILLLQHNTVLITFMNAPGRAVEVAVGDASDPNPEPHVGR